MERARFIEKMRCYSADFVTHVEMTHDTNYWRVHRHEHAEQKGEKGGQTPIVFFICVCSQNFQVQTGMTSNCQAARQSVPTPSAPEYINFMTQFDTH